MVRRRAFAGVVLGLGALLGCNSQVTPQYTGEPLATIRGSVVSSSPAPPSGVNAAIVWMDPDPDVFVRVVGQKVLVSGSFPASFTIRVVDPPPAEGETIIYRTADGGVDGPIISEHTGWWEGYVTALAPGVADGELHPSDVLGVDIDHAVLYFDHDLGPGEGMPNVPPTKGYHFASITHASQADRDAYQRCVHGDFCAHSVDDPTDWGQEQSDWFYNRCVESSPSATTCTVGFNGPMTDAMVQCEAQSQAHPLNPNCTYPTVVQTMNPNGFDDPSTIVIGATLEDATLGISF